MVNLPERGAISDNSLEIIEDGGIVIEDGKIIEVDDFLSLRNLSICTARSRTTSEVVLCIR